MQLYLVSRRRAWWSEEELAAAVDCAPAVNATFAGEIRWIHSYVVREPDGAFTAYCLYEATGPEAIRRHADAAMLPATAIEPVAATLVAPADPVGVPAAA